MLYRLILHIIKIGISFNESPHTSQSFEHEELESENVISLRTSNTMLFLTHISENKRAVIPIIGVIIVLAPSHIINIWKGRCHLLPKNYKPLKCPKRTSDFTELPIYERWADFILMWFFPAYCANVQWDSTATHHIFFFVFCKHCRSCHFFFTEAIFKVFCSWWFYHV